MHSHQQMMYDVGKLKDFDPDIIWIHTTWRNIKNFPNMKSTADEINSAYMQAYCFLSEQVTSLRRKVALSHELRPSHSTVESVMSAF